MVYFVIIPRLATDHEGSDRRVYHVSPTEEASVVDRRQLVAMESILPVGRRVQRNYEESGQDEDIDIAGDNASATGGHAHRYRNHYSAGQPRMLFNLTICRFLAHLGCTTTRFESPN
jgi:hypothetical protein